MTQPTLSGTDGGENGGGGSSNNASAAAQAIGFITEFNQNAAIIGILVEQFDLVAYIASRAHTLAESNARLWTENIPEMRSQLATLMILARSSSPASADDDDFQDCAHTAGPC